MSKYRLSFTTGGLFASEAALAAPLFLELENGVLVRAELMDRNLLQQRTVQSKRTMSREVVNRLATLSRAELTFLIAATAQERTHLMWVAACRRYSLIAQFAEEVVREKFVLMTPQVAMEDFDSFVRAKALWHEELTTLADSTHKKLRQNVFKMLREAEMLSVDGHIVHTLPSARVAKLLADRDSAQLRIFPMTDADIERAAQ